MTQTGYPFEFIGSNTVGADRYLQETLIYVFRSEKSGHRYQVNIERYAENLYWPGKRIKTRAAEGFYKKSVY